MNLSWRGITTLRITSHHFKFTCVSCSHWAAWHNITHVQRSTINTSNSLVYTGCVYVCLDIYWMCWVSITVYCLWLFEFIIIEMNLFSINWTKISVYNISVIHCTSCISDDIGAKMVRIAPKTYQTPKTKWIRIRFEIFRIWNILINIKIPKFFRIESIWEIGRQFEWFFSKPIQIRQLNSIRGSNGSWSSWLKSEPTLIDFPIVSMNFQANCFKLNSIVRPSITYWHLSSLQYSQHFKHLQQEVLIWNHNFIFECHCETNLSCLENVMNICGVSNWSKTKRPRSKDDVQMNIV